MVTEYLNAFLISLDGPPAYLAIFGSLLASGLGVPVPEDVSLFAAALLAYYGKADVHLMVAVSFAGVMIGDSFVFWMGARYGQRLLTIPFFRKLLHPERFARVQESFHKHGQKILFAARFMPGLRTPTFFSAGMMGIPYWRLLLYDGGAATISVPAIVYIVWIFGDQFHQVIQRVKTAESFIIGAVVLAALFFVLRAWRKARAEKQQKSSDVSQ